MKAYKIIFTSLICCLLAACSIDAPSSSKRSRSKSSDSVSSQSSLPQEKVDYDAFKEEVDKRTIGSRGLPTLRTNSTVNGKAIVETFELVLVNNLPSPSRGYLENVFAYKLVEMSNPSSESVYSHLSETTFIRDAASMVSCCEAIPQYKEMMNYYINPLGWDIVGEAGSSGGGSSSSGSNSRYESSMTMIQKDTCGDDLFIINTHIDIERIDNGDTTTISIDGQFVY